MLSIFFSYIDKLTFWLGKKKCGFKDKDSIRAGEDKRAFAKVCPHKGSGGKAERGDPFIFGRGEKRPSFWQSMALSLK